MRDIIRQWGKLIGSYLSFRRREVIQSVIESPIADTGESGAVASKPVSNTLPSEDRPNDAPDTHAEVKKAWYIVEQIPRHDVLPHADPDDIVTIEHTCLTCPTHFPVGVKVWKIRSCNYVGTACPSCKQFQTLDMNEVRQRQFVLTTTGDALYQINA
jgi:hypothetical protein